MERSAQRGVEGSALPPSLDADRTPLPLVEPEHAQHAARGVPDEDRDPDVDGLKGGEPQDEEAFMDTYELEVSTADTLPLEEAIKESEHKVEQPVAATESFPREENMETEPRNDSQGDSDVLLDLGDYEPVQATADDDFVLDLDD